MSELTIEDFKNDSNFLNLVFNSINTAIFVVDSNACIYMLNKALSTIFYMKPEGIIDKYCGNALGCINVVNSNIKCGESKKCPGCVLRKSIKYTITTKKNLINKTFKQVYLIKGKRIKKTFHFSTRYIRYNEKDLVVIFLNDITKLEKQKKKLQKMNIEKNRILGMAAHDLRNPLSVISVYSSILLENKDLDDEQKNFLKKIYQTSINMANIISDILDISAIESGIVNINYQKVNYIELMKNIIETNGYLSNNKGIKIDLVNKLCCDDFLVVIDKSKIEQVLNNLIYNAIKYSNSGTKITVEVSLNEKYLKTSVIDQGIGIDESELDKIFQPFYKSKNRGTNNEPSTGLGLAIVKRIVDAHKGKIYVESKKGVGSTFTFELPISI